MWGFRLFGFDFWVGIFGDVVGNVFLLIIEVNFFVVEILFFVFGVFNGCFVCIFSVEV